MLAPVPPALSVAALGQSAQSDQVASTSGPETDHGEVVAPAEVEAQPELTDDPEAIPGTQPASQLSQPCLPAPPNLFPNPAAGSSDLPMAASSLPVPSLPELPKPGEYVICEESLCRVLCPPWMLGSARRGLLNVSRPQDSSWVDLTRVQWSTVDPRGECHLLEEHIPFLVQMFTDSDAQELPGSGEELLAQQRSCEAYSVLFDQVPEIDAAFRARFARLSGVEGMQVGSNESTEMESDSDPKVAARSSGSETREESLAGWDNPQTTADGAANLLPERSATVPNGQPSEQAEAEGSEQAQASCSAAPLWAR